MVWRQGNVEMVAYMNKAGGWDEEVATLIARLAPKATVIYDIGANAGYMTMVAANAAPNAAIHAFEPIPALAADVAASALENGFTNVQAHNVALSDGRGTATIHVPRHMVHASFVPRASAEAIEVQTFALDNLVRSGELPPPSLIKIDVEGAEMMVLRGAEQTLREHRPILIYECDENAARFGHTPGSVIEWLQQLGYTRFTFLGKKGAPDVEVTPAEAREGDFLAI